MSEKLTSSVRKSGFEVNLRYEPEAAQPKIRLMPAAVVCDGTPINASQRRPRAEKEIT